MIHVGPVRMRIEGDFVGRTGLGGKLFGHVPAKSIESLAETDSLGKHNIHISLTVHEGKAEYFSELTEGDIVEVWGILEQQRNRGKMINKKGEKMSRPGFMYIWPQKIRIIESKKIDTENEYSDSEVPI